MNAPPEKVWDCIKPLPGTLRAKWDENVTSFEIIESLTDVSLSKHGYSRGSGSPLGRGSTPHGPGTAADTGCPLLAMFRPDLGPGAGGKPCDQMGGDALSSQRYSTGQGWRRERALRSLKPGLVSSGLKWCPSMGR